MYTAVKHFHFITIAISALMLTLRYGLMMAESSYLKHPFFSRFPHLNDSILLLTGFGLIYMTGQVPYTGASDWMTEKMTCVMAYFALAFFTLKMARNGWLRTFAFLGALGWLIMAGNLAMNKVPSLLG